MKRELKKTCVRCKADKPVSEFNKQKATLDGLQVWCRACGIAYKEERKIKQQDKDKIIFNPNTPAF